MHSTGSAQVYTVRAPPARKNGCLSAALPGVRRSGVGQTGIHRPVEEAGCRPGGGRGAAQSPGPPARTVVLRRALALCQGLTWRPKFLHSPGGGGSTFAPPAQFFVSTPIPICGGRADLPLGLLDVPVLAAKDAAYHGEKRGYAELFLVRFQKNNRLREGVQFDGGNLRFQFRVVVNGLIDLCVALAGGDGLGDRQVALGQLLVDRCGLLLRIVHGRLDSFSLVFAEF